MIPDLLQRRYGHGVVRLAIGHPAGGVSLSSLARKPVEREVRFATMPLLICTGIAFLLVSATQLGPQSTLMPPSVPLARMPEIEIVLWSDPVATSVEVAQAPAAIEPPAIIPSEIEPAPEPSSRMPDIDHLAMRPLAMPVPVTASDVRPAQGRASGPRPAPLSTSRPRPKLAIAGLADAAPVVFEAEGGVAVVDRARDVRPRATTRGHEIDSVPVWTTTDTRRAFLAENETSATTAPKLSHRPAVAAASNPSIVTDALRAAGWHEVPLDALPDCKPVGRQDLLKKRILLAAPFERECSHQDGSYRFLETRNLGAFLMWSRPNPDRPARQRGVRDACFVLEQALRCLDESSIEESSER